VKALHPRARVVGVEPEASPDTQRSLRAGRRVRVEIERSIADGQLLPEPGVQTFAVVAALVDDIVTVADEEIVETMRFVFERMKVVVEPSGASALAALMAGRVPLDGARAGVVLSGGNVDAERFAALVAPRG
jgi:threonine dehydratase